MLIQRESITDIEAAAARIERTLLMIPGPTAITAEVLAAGARPVLSHSDPRMRSFVAESLARLRSLFDAPSAQPIITAGSGTLAMEIGLANLIEPGDRVLILESGVFGGRFRTIAELNGAEVPSRRRRWATPLTRIGSGRPSRISVRRSSPSRILIHPPVYGWMWSR